MPFLWSLSSSDWIPSPVDSSNRSYTFTDDPGSPVRVSEPAESPVERPLLVRTAGGSTSPAVWGLLCRPGDAVRVNGRAVPGGLRVLRDRDEICDPFLGSLFFTTDSTPVIEPLPSLEHRIECHRCRQEIAPGSPAVRCPNCGTWHHQDEALPCWTYTERCGVCSQPTSLDGGFRWTPEAL